MTQMCFLIRENTFYVSLAKSQLLTYQCCKKKRLGWNSATKTCQLTCFLVHHVLLSTVVFDSINHESAAVPLTERWICLPEECKPLRLLSIWTTMWSKCCTSNRCSNPTKQNRQ